MNPIDEVRSFVMRQVLEPALASPTLSKKAKDQIRSTNGWLKKFGRVGDLVHYLSRFDVDNGDPLYVEMKGQGLLTFEDISTECRHRFGQWAHDRTRMSDFVIGQAYSTHEILIFANSYDLRSGGMFVLEGHSGAPAAVVIKATLKDGPYPNAWIEQGRRLKYFFKAISGRFGDHYKPNDAILKNPGLPILAFVRGGEKQDFVYHGVFNLIRPHKEEDGSKWFELALCATQPSWVLASNAFIETELAERVKRARSEPQESRLARLAAAPKRPATTTSFSTTYLRNADVIAEVLHLANGVCGGCYKPAPFHRASDNSPYLEVHHVVPLAAGGDDTVENAMALCPNCHRQRHFGRPVEGTI